MATASIPAPLAIIGGSGLYDMPDLKDRAEVAVETPFGTPSDTFVTGTLHGQPVVFVPRHGKGHRFLPSEVPYRANIWALKKLGVQYVLSVSAVGSLREDIAPGDLVVIDQYIDRTVGRDRTYFGDGLVGHVAFADPVCAALRTVVLAAAEASPARAVDGGTYVCIEGPTFSTRAESKLFQAWGASVIGMTNMPEARLAREAGLSYATLALSTDYDAWRDDEEHVTADAVIAVLKQNVENARDVIRRVAEAMAGGALPAPAPHANAAQFAVMTPGHLVPAETKRRTALLFGHAWQD